MLAGAGVVLLLVLVAAMLAGANVVLLLTLVAVVILWAGAGRQVLR